MFFAQRKEYNLLPRSVLRDTCKIANQKSSLNSYVWNPIVAGFLTNRLNLLIMQLATTKKLIRVNAVGQNTLVSANSKFTRDVL